jgi:N-acetylglucosamine-6-sulfatase
MPLPTRAAPNIVVIMTDDQDDMGSVDTMPAVNELLKQQGVTFTNSFVDYPLCGPSRASLLTGQAFHNHRVRQYPHFQPREANSLGPWLQAVGYRTALIGKYLNRHGSSDPIPPGWNTWVRHGRAGTGGATDALAAHAIDFVRTTGTGEPFFMLVTPTAPHGRQFGSSPPMPAARHAGAFNNLPLPNRPNFNEEDVSDKPGLISALPLVDPSWMTDIFRRRRESLLAVDDMVRSLIGVLTETGRLDNTYVVFTSDNGFSEGAHRWVGKSVPYEESIRVPLIVRGPGVMTGAIRTELVNNLDLAATILDWAGATAGNALDGRSLRPLLAPGEIPWRTAILTQMRRRGHRVAAVRTRTHLYAETRGSALEREYYNLEADPYQLANQTPVKQIASTQTAVPASLLRMLRQRLRNCVGDGCWIAD